MFHAADFLGACGDCPLCHTGNADVCADNAADTLGREADDMADAAREREASL